MNLDLVNDLISLVGKTWRVISCNGWEASVEPSTEFAISSWRYGISDIHRVIMRKMYDVLKFDEMYEYLDDVAVKELIRIRIQAKESKVTDFIYEFNGLI